jgi:hypothetical protein
MAGVAHIVSNRVSAGWEGGDWLKIIANAPIHSSSNVADMDFTSYVDVWSPDFRWLYAEVEKIYSGEKKDDITVSADPRKVGGNGRPQPGLFYANLNNISRQWFKDNIVGQREQHPILASAGTITFFG